MLHEFWPCHIPSPPIQKIYFYSDTALSTSNLQAHLLQQPPFLQHILTVVM